MSTHLRSLQLMFDTVGLVGLSIIEKVIVFCSANERTVRSRMLSEPWLASCSLEACSVETETDGERGSETGNPSGRIGENISTAPSLNASNRPLWPGPSHVHAIHMRRA